MCLRHKRTVTHKRTYTQSTRRKKPTRLVGSRCAVFSADHSLWAGWLRFESSFTGVSFGETGLARWVVSRAAVFAFASRAGATQSGQIFSALFCHVGQAEKRPATISTILFIANNRKKAQLWLLIVTDLLLLLNCCCCRLLLSTAHPRLMAGALLAATVNSFGGTRLICGRKSA